MAKRALAARATEAEALKAQLKTLRSNIVEKFAGKIDLKDDEGGAASADQDPGKTLAGRLASVLVDGEGEIGRPACMGQLVLSCARSVQVWRSRR